MNSSISGATLVKKFRPALSLLPASGIGVVSKDAKVVTRHGTRVSNLRFTGFGLVCGFEPGKNMDDLLRVSGFSGNFF